MIAILLLLFLTGVMTEEVSTPASLLRPRNFNPHPYTMRQFLEESSASPTKQGPVTFPDDGPPPPKTPLIVTSRPLIDSIARSELSNNTVGESSFISAVTYKPYLARVQDYQAFAPNVPYADMLKKAEERGFLRASGYNEYERRTVLPPIYKALSEHARQNVLNAAEKPASHYQPRTKDYSQDYSQEYNDISNENLNSDYDQNKNYAFSYSVKDHKTGDDFSHSQQSHGSATNGEYRVRLPDGREQIVSYTADENGYKADVRYDGDPINHNNINYNQYNTNDLKLDSRYNVDSDNRIDNYNNNDLSLGNNIYQTDYKVKEEIPSAISQYDSNEYYNDYSDKNYVPGSKYALFNPSSTASYVTTVKPTYGEIKDFLNKIHTTSAPNYVDENAVDVNKPYDDTDEVVVIGANRYTDVSEGISKLPTYVTPSPESYVTKYSSFKDPSKHILSDSYINRINKYLTFNKK